MKLARLYIEDFMCFKPSYIDFSLFNAALIIGKQNHNDLVSNGVGKTTIFRAIEYVLFNQVDVIMEKIVRDDANSCQVVLDFVVGDQEYRLARSRTRKGTSDLVLLQRNAKAGEEVEVYHNAEHMPYTEKKDTEQYWKDLSGGRAGDTERDLAKLIKINAKSFRSTVHFLQNDLTGLPTATPEKRKQILKDALNLIVYTKLEKIAKERANGIAKDIDKNKIVIETLGSPGEALLDLAKQLASVDEIIQIKNNELAHLNSDLSLLNIKINELINAHANIEGKFVNLLTKEQSLTADKNRLEISTKEYTSKKSNVIKAAKELVKEVAALKLEQVRLAEIDYSQIDILTEQISSKKESVTSHNINIKTSMENYEQLKIPLPKGSRCERCRQSMSDKHKQDCIADDKAKMTKLQEGIQESKKIIVTTNAEILAHQQIINSLSLCKQQLEGINTKITAKNKEILDKQALHDEYKTLLTKFIVELAEKTKELDAVAEELKNSSIDDAKNLKLQIEEEKTGIVIITAAIATLNKELTHFTNNKAVIQHGIDQKTKDNLKLMELKKILGELDEKMAVYPSVLQAFSSTGIPNLIIQNVLDDLQIEANNLLSQLNPLLQLSFSVEKTVEKTGDQADTLDINYTVNGRDRYYEVLSGAQKLAVTFSLKLGLSFLLQKMIGTDIKFLLLDETDQSLDKASTDAYADLVKFFQKDYTILVITHDDRLKDKFSHAILVEQDMNMVSTAKVVSSW